MSHFFHLNFLKIMCPSGATSISKELTSDNDITTSVSEMEVVNEKGIHSSSVLMAFKIVFNNIDNNVNLSHMRQDQQTQFMHYYHSYAVCEERFYVVCLSLFLIINPVLSIPVTKILPFNCDQQSLLHNFAILISCLITDNLPYFQENYSDILQSDICV